MLGNYLINYFTHTRTMCYTMTASAHAQILLKPSPCTILPVSNGSCLLRHPLDPPLHVFACDSMPWMRVYIAVSLISIAEISAALDGSSRHVHDHSVAESLVRMATRLTSLTIGEIDARNGSEYAQLATDLVQHARTMRFSEYSPYLSNPFDVGPINQCSYPELDVCNFESGYTVPEYVARTLQRYNSLFSDLRNRISSVLSSRCTNSWMNFLCRATVGPQCISSTTVRYQTNNYDVSIQIVAIELIRSSSDGIFCSTIII